MPNHELIYRQEAEQYDLMIAKQPFLDDVIQKIRPYVDKDIVDLGAGTGRLTNVLAAKASSIIALDASTAMLELTAQKLIAQGLSNWKTRVADHRALPLENQSTDLVVAGWSICYLTSATHQEWKGNLAQIMAELARILRQDGTIIILETMGTGCAQPNPPDFLIPYYRELTKSYGFSHKVISMDYHFDSVEQATELTRFFFGEELAKQVKAKQSSIVPEYAGVWWKHI